MNYKIYQVRVYNDGTQEWYLNGIKVATEALEAQNSNKASNNATKPDNDNKPILTFEVG
jgi:hypothetical protein